MFRVWFVSSALAKTLSHSHPRLLLDVIDEIQIARIAAVLQLLGRRQMRLGTERLKAQEQKRAHQILAIDAILAHAQHNAVHVQLVLGELQQRDERLLGGLGQQNVGQRNVQHVVVRVQHRLPAAAHRLRHVQLQRDLDGLLLVEDALDAGILVVGAVEQLVMMVDGRLVEGGREINVRVLRGAARVHRGLASFVACAKAEENIVSERTITTHLYESYTCHDVKGTPYRDLICGGKGHQDHHRGPTPRETE